MFKRRQKPTFKKRMKRMLWPEGGWKRYLHYMLLRLNRLSGTPKTIAAGVACGAAISFTPFVGFHLILAAVTAFIVRGNIVASAIGTIVGNPWTFPFIWVSVLYTGRVILGQTGEGRVEFVPIFEKAFHALMTFDFRLLASDVWPVIWPMIVGCIPYYIITWVISYYLVKKALDKIEASRKNKTNKIRL